MKVLSGIVVFVALSVVMFPVVVHADTLVGTKISATDPASDSIHFDFQGQQGWTSAVQFEAQIRDDNGELVNGGEWFRGFCVELSQFVQYDEDLDVDLVVPGQVAGGQQAAWLMEYRESYKATHAEWSDYEITGLQLAIWEVTHDYNDALDFNLYEGAFKVLDPLPRGHELANYYLQDLTAHFDPTGLDYYYSIAQHSEMQDLIFHIPGNDDVVVPEPATLLLVGFGLLGLIGIHRKRSS